MTVIDIYINISDVLSQEFRKKRIFFSYIGFRALKGIYPEFQVIRGFSQKIPAGVLSYDEIHS